MSDTDSFIAEVNEEVRREQLYGYVRKYGWIAVVAVVGIVGSAAYFELTSARETAAAQAAGDAIFAALDNEDADARVSGLSAISSTQSEAAAIVAMLTAREAEEAGDIDAAVAALAGISNDGALPIEYQQLATLKSLMLQRDVMSAEDRRIGFEALANPGSPFRMLAAEQIALISIEQGLTEQAIAELEAIRADAEASGGLRERASGVIVALGGVPLDVNAVPAAQGN